MALVVPGGTANVLKGNTWWSSGAADAVQWTWGASEGAGFAGWQAASKDAGAVWRDPKFPDPAAGQ